jgi:hypothetical protein
MSDRRSPDNGSNLGSDQPKKVGFIIFLLCCPKNRRSASLLDFVTRHHFAVRLIGLEKTTSP